MTKDVVTRNWELGVEMIYMYRQVIVVVAAKNKREAMKLARQQALADPVAFAGKPKLKVNVIDDVDQTDLPAGKKWICIERLGRY